MYIFIFLFKLSTFSHIWSTAAAAQALSGSKFYSVNCFNLRPTKWKTLNKAKRKFTILLKSLCCWCTHWDEKSQDQCDPKQFYLSNHLLNINSVPSEQDTLSPLSYSMSFIQSACSVQNFPLLLCLFLCFRLSLYFHCVTSSSFFSPHFPSAHPSLVFLPDYKHVVIPLIAVSNICFSFSSSPCSSWFLSLFSPLISAFFFFLLHFVSTPLFPHSYSVSLLFPSPIIHPIIIFWTRLIHFFSHSHLAFCHFFICLSHPSPPPQSIYSIYPSFFTLQFSLTLSATLTLHPSFPTWFHFPLNPPICPSFSPNLSSQHDIYRLSLLYLHRPFLPNPHLSFPIFPLPTHHHPSIFINFLFRISFTLLSCSHPPTPLPFPPHLSIIVSYFDIFFLF